MNPVKGFKHNVNRIDHFQTRSSKCQWNIFYRHQFIRDLPLEKLLAESDAPYIGQTPSDALEAIKTIAEIKGLEVEAVKKQLLQNTIAFFGIK